MPIRKENRHRYSAAAGWPEIRRQVLLWDRNRCAFCSLPNGALIDSRDRTVLEGMAAEVASVVDGVKVVQIVLTIAHLDGGTDHSDPANLRALCQKCHLTLDGKQHARNAAITRAKKRTVVGQQEIQL